MADVGGRTPGAVDGKDDVAGPRRSRAVLSLTQLQQALKGERVDVGDRGDVVAAPHADAVRRVAHHAHKLRVVPAGDGGALRACQG